MKKAKRKKPISKKVCPICGEENRLYYGHNLWCIKCDEHKIKIYCRDELRKNKKRIALGLIKSGRIG